MLRKGATLEWTKQCENAFKLLKAELAKMPDLQYPNPNKPFKLFTDASKHIYSGILHQEKEGQADAKELELILIAYLSGSFHKTQQIWNTMQKYAMHPTNQLKFTFYLSGTNCTFYCNH